jgi:hypothetical protein
MLYDAGRLALNAQRSTLDAHRLALDAHRLALNAQRWTLVLIVSTCIKLFRAFSVKRQA